MVREAKLSWNDIRRSSASEMGLRNLWDDSFDIDEPATIQDTPDSSIDEKTSEARHSASKKNKNSDKNLSDADWMNWD